MDTDNRSSVRVRVPDHPRRVASSIAAIVWILATGFFAPLAAPAVDEEQARAAGAADAVSNDPVVIYARYRRQGGAGRGVESRSLEAAVCAARPGGDGSTRRVLLYDERFIGRSEAPRFAEDELTVERAGERSVYRARYGRARSVEVEVNGKSVRHVNRHMDREIVSRAVPLEMVEPRVFDEEIVATLAWLLADRLATSPAVPAAPNAPAPLGALDGWHFQAISARQMGLFECDMTLRGRETLHLSAGAFDLACFELSARRVTSDASAEQSPPPVVQRLWLTDAGIIVKVQTIPGAGRDDVDVAYHLAFHNGLSATCGEREMPPATDGSAPPVPPAEYATSDVRPRLVEGMAPERRAALLIIDGAESVRGAGDTPEGGAHDAFRHSLRRGIAVRGAVVLAASPRTLSDPGVIVTALHAAVEKRAEVDPDRVFLLTRGPCMDYVPALLRRTPPVAGWIVVDPMSPEGDWTPPVTDNRLPPIVVVTSGPKAEGGAAGPLAVATARVVELLSKVATQVTVVPVAGADKEFRAPMPDPIGPRAGESEPAIWRETSPELLDAISRLMGIPGGAADAPRGTPREERR